MRPSAVLAVAVLAALAAGCGPDTAADREDSFQVTADTIDPELLAPGTILRQGPATPEAMAGPVRPPVLAGAKGQISISQGYFVRAPCATSISVRASRGDTITVRVTSRPDTTAPDPCPETPKPIGYAMLVGQFEPGSYAVRLIHEGDGARPAPLDTVYENITVEPN